MIKESTEDMKKLKKKIRDELVRSKEKILDLFLAENKNFRRTPDF